MYDMKEFVAADLTYTAAPKAVPTKAHFSASMETPSTVPNTAQQHPFEWLEARVALNLGDDRHLLDNGRQARRATSCLLEAQAGDRVLVAAFSDGTTYLMHVLERVTGDEAALSVPGAQTLSLRQSRIEAHAPEGIALRSLREVELTAATGTVSINASNVFLTVGESLVQQARQYVGKFANYLLEAQQLLRLHGRDALITAERDVKVDAERISMG